MLKLRSLLEDADPNELDPTRFPTKLSQVDADKAKDYVAAGPEDGEPVEDDRIKVVPKTFSVQELKPSQSSMNIEKALGMAIGMINRAGPFKNGPGGDLGAFISIDNHIMDGHHRWVASGMLDPNAKVGGYQVNFPGDKLIPVLNALTAGKFGVTQGKAATGGFDQFKEGPIRDTLQKYLAQGTKFDSPEVIRQAIETFTGMSGEDAVEAAINTFVTNLSKLNFELPTGAPSREDMPVLDGPDVTTAVNALNKGEIDVNPPYKESVQQKFKRIARI